MSSRIVKVLFPTGSIYPSQEGGPSNTVYWLAQELTRSGEQIFVIATNKGTQQHQICYDLWLQTSFGHVMYTKEIHRAMPIKLIIRSIRTLRRVDVVHLTSLFYPASLPLALAALMFNKTTLWSPRGELDDNALVYKTWKKRPVLFLIRNVFKNKVYFHSTSAKETEDIHRKLKCNRNRIIQIPNYFPVHPVNENGRVDGYILYLGRIHPIKALDNLIQAIADSTILKEKGYTLKIAGEMKGPYAEKIESLVQALGVSDRVHFVGYIEGTKKEELLAHARCTVLPSHSENFGIAVIESLAHGTPVIASKGTPWEVLFDAGAGDWVDNDPRSLTQSIDRVCALSESEYLSMRGKAKCLAAKFDIRNNIHLWQEAYRRAVENS